MKLKILIVGSSLVTLVISLTLSIHAQTFSVIHDLVPGRDGVFPHGGVTIKAGTLYYTTYDSSQGGSIYQLAHVGSTWAASPLLFLISAGNGPKARVAFGPDGHLYGTTSTGDIQHQGGVVFRLTPPLSICKTANCFWTENVLHDFAMPDGLNPQFGDLVWDRQGNLYGTTSNGGAHNMGVVFEMTKAGNVWTETPIYSFSGPDGGNPQNQVIVDDNGNLFGTTLQGGAQGSGTVFKLSNIPGTGWTETVLYSFTHNDLNGEGPFAGLVADASGNLYGATSAGGSGLGGTIFELSPSGNAYTFKLLYSFAGNSGECGPFEPLSMDAAGNLYGTTYCDGAFQQGNVFKLTNTGNGWEYSSLHDFTGGNDGALPISHVTIDADGVLYGTASEGGSKNSGVVWQIK